MINLTDKQKAILAIVAAVIISGGGPVFTKIALRTLTPEYFSFLRFLISSIILAPLFLKSRLSLDRETLKLIGISLLSSANILLFAHGVKTTTVTVAQLLYVLSPMVIFALSYFLIKEKATFSKITGIAIGVFGATLIILLPIIEKNGVFSGDIKGNILISAGVLFFSIYTVLSKGLLRKFSPLQITQVFSLTTMVTMLILSFPQIIKTPTAIFSISEIAVLSVLIVGVINTAIYYLLQQYAIKHGSPLIASTILLMVPFSTLLWAGVLLNERLTPLLVIGGALVLAGTYFIIKPNKH